MSSSNWTVRLFIIVSLLAGSAVHGQIVVPGADGSDGAFNPSGATYEVDLSAAPTGAWDGPNVSPGNGVYDPEKWAVVFRYSEVNIPPGQIVTFKNHPSRAPVVWLVSGEVRIGGLIEMNGKLVPSSSAALAEPGPGGFRGGRAFFTGASVGFGFGPGGGITAAHAEPRGAAPAYGNSANIPLMGGSGGSGWTSSNTGGGGGGGALLIASQSDITLGIPYVGDPPAPTLIGGIHVNGRGLSSNFPSSGGAIRLVADRIVNGLPLFQLRALAGQSGASTVASPGRIRLEANLIELADSGAPAASMAVPTGGVAQIWPDAGAPAVRIVSIGGAPVPADIRASFQFPNADIMESFAGPTTVVVEARNVPATWTMTVRAVPYAGPDIRLPATFQSGTLELSTWTVEFGTTPANALPPGHTALQVRAAAP